VITVGIVRPGAMGAAIGRVLASGGARVVATVAGRSERTRLLAAGLELLPTLDDVVGESAIVLSIAEDGTAKGSGRSIDGFDLLGGLDCCSDLLQRYGGHRAAAGMELPADRIDSFREAMAEHAKSVLPAEGVVEPELIDAFVAGLARATGESLPLLPPRRETAAAPREREPGEPPTEVERPRGRILVYWGCGETVRAGQPRVIDFARAAPSDFASAFAGRHVPDRGARIGPNHVLYPNERNTVVLARDSPLAGQHRIQGPGVPASVKFSLRPHQAREYG